MDGGFIGRRELLRGLLAAIGLGALPLSKIPRARASSSSRPYLFFTAADIDGLRRKCATSMKPQLDALIGYARAHLDDPVPTSLEGDYERKADILQSPFLVNIVNFAFLAVITGEPRYRAAARRWALVLASMKDLVGTFSPEGKCVDCGYPEGWANTALAVAYDWLYPHLTASERAAIRRQLARITRALHEAAAGDEWWTRAYLHHDTWIPLGGLGIGAMALLDDTSEALAWADRAASELLSALDWLASDGAWPEGPCGWAFALHSVLPFLDAYRRRLPERAAALTRNAWLANTWKFRVASRVPSGLFLTFGDCRETGAYQFTAFEGAPALRYLAAKYENPYAQWQAAREWEKRPNAYTAAWEIIWMDPNVPEAPPDDLPTGTLFDNQGIAFLRTGWRARDTVVAFRCDSLLGRRAASLFRPDRAAQFNNSTTHVHADANSFAVWSRGSFALATARYGQNETRFHSTLLVDGQGQYTRFSAKHLGRPDGAVVDFFASRHASFVTGDASRAYPPGLTRYVRRLYLIQPGIVFVVDDVAAERSVALEWRLHVDRAAQLDLRDDGFTSLLYGSRTWVRVASPAAARFGEEVNTWNRAVTLSPAGPRKQARFVAAVIPSLPASATPTLRAPAARAFVIEALGARVTAAFDGREIPGRLSTDGAAAIVSEMAGSAGFLVAGATNLIFGGEPVFHASTPVTASYAREHGEGKLTVAAPRPAHITLRGGVTLRVPAGTSSHDIE